MSTLVATGELYKFRSLVTALVVRHVSSRYRGSVLGFLWSFMNPLCLMLVYTLVFHYMMRVSSEQHYHITLFAGLLPWLWTTSALIEGTSSIVSSGHLITKSMFPSQVLPLVSVLSTMVNFILSLPILLVFILVAGVPIHWTWVLLPLLIVAHCTLLFGLVLALSAVNVFYRDVQHIIGNVLTFLFFLCPIVYPAEMVPENFRFILVWNPFAVLTEMYRDVLLRGVAPSVTQLLMIVAAAGVSLIIGNLIHSGMRERFAEAL